MVLISNAFLRSPFTTNFFFLVIMMISASFFLLFCSYFSFQTILLDVLFWSRTSIEKFVFVFSFFLVL